MNFLAHFLLSNNSAPLIIGNYLADFLKGDSWKRLPPEMQQGVRLHRFIDAFTDAHAGVRVNVGRLRPTAGRYAAPAMDILSDFLLTHHWEKHDLRPQQSFCDGIYSVLAEHLYLFPEPVRSRTVRMMDANWLMHYRAPEGLHFVFERFTARLSRPFLVGPMADTFWGNFESFSNEFNPFFRELLHETKSVIAEFQRSPTVFTDFKKS